MIKTRIMADVKALSILSELIKDFKNIQDPPESIDAIASYNKSVEEVLDGARTEVSKVKSYIEQVERKIGELRNATKSMIKKNQDAIQNICETFKPGKGGQIPAKESAIAKLQLVHELQKISQNIMNDRLSELMQETEIVCAKVKDGVDFCYGDIEGLYGCLASWKDAKAQSFEEEKQRKLEEQRLKDEEERLVRRELEKRAEKEREEQKKKEAEERERREKEEVKRKAEEERRGREEQKRREENQRMRREQKEKEKKEREEQKREKEKEDAERKAVEERRRTEEQRQRKENERMRRERKERENKEREEQKRKEEEEREKRRKEEAERKAEEKLRRREEQRLREDKERMRREREEREKNEREEQKKKEKEERERREKEKAERMAEEERRRKQEEEILRKKEEEEERKRREEEAVKKRKEERQRLEAERRDREKLEKEAEERDWRQDPNNWNPVTYSRYCGEVDGLREYHGGIKCIIASPPASIEQDDLECSARDEVDTIIETLETDEKPVSSIIDIHSMIGNFHSEVPTRIYIPHHSGFCSTDETVVKISVNQTDWITVYPIPTTPNMEEQEKLVKKLAGVEVNDFSSLKAIVVTRPRCQTIIVDKPDISAHSRTDKNVKLFVPRNAFSSRTELKLMVQPVSEQTLASFVKDNKDLDNILAVSSVVTLICGKHPAKAIEVDLMKSSQKQSNGKTYQMYTAKDMVWKFADVEYEGHQVTIMLPAGREKHTIMEIDMPTSFPKENVPSVAEALHTCINKTVVVMIAKQHAGDLKKCAFRIVRRESVKDTLEFLRENGYTEGPDFSAEFSLQEGQELEVSFTGNIENATETDKPRILTYLTYMGGAATDITLRVKDSWKQKDLPAYVGTIRCTVLRRHGSSETLFSRSITLTISLPKPKRTHTAIGVARVRFPYYLTTLAAYLSEILCNDDRNIWQTVLRSLLGNSEFSPGYRIAKRKSVEDTDELICRAMLLDWMKAQAVHEDKLEAITAALKYNGHRKIAKSCVDFVKFQKDNLTDAVLIELSQGITKDVQTFGQDLGLDPEEITSCTKEHFHSMNSQYIAVMMEWRESVHVIKHGVNAIEYLRKICV